MKYLNGHSLTPSGNHQFFPILLAFQFSEFTHMVHNQIIRSPAQLTFLSFQPVYKACGADAGHWILSLIHISGCFIRTGGGQLTAACSFLICAVNESPAPTPSATSTCGVATYDMAGL